MNHTPNTLEEKIDDFFERDADLRHLKNELKPELLALINDTVIAARIDELESLYTTEPRIETLWINNRIAELRTHGAK